MTGRALPLARQAPAPILPARRRDGREGRDIAAVFAALRIVSRLPLACLYPVGRLLMPLALAIAPSRRRVAEQNLAAVFPGAGLRALMRRFYAVSADLAMESIRLLSIPKPRLGARLRLEGAEALDGGGALVLAAHHGNMLWAVGALADAVPAPVFVVYKPPHGDVLHRMLEAIGARFDGTLTPLREVRRTVLRCRQEHGVLVLVADQQPRAAERREVEFCGRRTAFFAGPDRIGRALDWPVYYLSCRRTGRGRYLCRVEKLCEPPYEQDDAGIVRRYAARLEADIRDAPEDWLWFHKRWKD